MSDPAYDELTGAEPLSEVRVVHNYVQLVFWPHTLSLYPRLRASVDGRILTQTDDGYYDSICRLIGQHVVDVTRDKGMQLSFEFSGGTRLLLSLRPEHAVGPEIAMLSDNKGGLMVERYGE